MLKLFYFSMLQNSIVNKNGLLFAVAKVIPFLITIELKEEKFQREAEAARGVEPS